VQVPEYTVKGSHGTWPGLTHTAWWRDFDLTKCDTFIVCLSITGIKIDMVCYQPTYLCCICQMHGRPKQVALRVM